MDHFKEKGYETELITLPGHENDRNEMNNLEDAIELFDKKMKRIGENPYYAIAFSQGALYLQLWLNKNPDHKPLKQVLLAPAFFLRRQEITINLFRLLPSFFLIKSFAPRQFRRYQFLKVSEYNILMEGILEYQKINQAFPVSTMIMIDPKDELVDASGLKKNAQMNNKKLLFYFLERPYLNKGIGQHHILFHPDYFDKQDWNRLTDIIENYLTDHF